MLSAEFAKLASTMLHWLARQRLLLEWEVSGLLHQLCHTLWNAFETTINVPKRPADNTLKLRVVPQWDDSAAWLKFENHARAFSGVVSCAGVQEGLLLLVEQHLHAMQIRLPVLLSFQTPVQS